MANTDWKQFAVIGAGAWVNPQNLLNNDLSYGSGGSLDTQVYYRWNFGIPAKSRVIGIYVRADAWQMLNVTQGVFSVAISVNGGASWSAYKTASINTTQTSYYFGGATDLWSQFPQAQDFNTDEFQIKIRSSWKTASSPPTPYIHCDYLTAQIFYIRPSEYLRLTDQKRLKTIR